MQIQKSIQLFLEKNNLLKTLQLFKNESKKTSVHYGPSKQSQLLNIHKFVLNSSNSNQIRQHFQKADPLVLKRAVKKLKRKNKVTNFKPQICLLTNMRFFKKLIQKQNQSVNLFGQNQFNAELRQSKSFINSLQQSRQYENEWDLQDEVGYQVYECSSTQLPYFSQQIIAHRKMTQQNSIKYVQFPEEYYEKYSQKINRVVENARDKKKSRLPPKIIFKKEEGQEVYPIQHNGITYDSYDLKIIYDREKTGFQQQRQLPIVINQVLAARYQVVALLGQAQFSKAIQVVDLEDNKNYCIKIIQNNKQQNPKDYFDQSIDQIKLLRFIEANCNPDQHHLLTLHDFFYHKQHLMIVTQLLKDSLLYAYQLPHNHFDLQAIKLYSIQILKALQKMHSLHIIHTDLKPENILIKSYSKHELKVIDVGSSIFFHDKLSFHVQTQSYRAPEVILGIPYDQKIDIWSFGCIIAEIFTKKVLFDSPTLPGILCKMQGLRGPWPSWMLERGKYSKKYFTKQFIPYEQIEQEESVHFQSNNNSSPQICRVYIPKLTNLKSRINTEDKLFLDFLSKCLKLDPSARLSAKQALKHPFLNQ